MEERVAFMMKNLERQLDDGDFDVDVFGFSRGAASATLFLNKIQEKINEGKDKRYQKINLRFTAIFDQVPSKRSMGGQFSGRTLDTIGYLGSLTFWSPDTYARNANNRGFTLNKDMKFEYRPLHLVSLDEQRKEFAVTDLNGVLPLDAKNRALQVGFVGVHSDIGGGYGGSIFEFIAREFVYEKSKEYGLSLWDEDGYAKLDAEFRPIYEKYKKGFRDSKGNRQLSWIEAWPHESDKAIFNGDEPRHLPQDLLLHESVDWFMHVPDNSILGYTKLRPGN